MTTINNHYDNDKAITELLIKSLPPKIHCADNKTDAFALPEMPTIKALEKRFIAFNSQSQISMMIFDIDLFAGLTAREYFGDIDGILGFITDNIGFEPTYILETDKGFHFAYHLKNHVFTHQSNALNYLRAVKQAICDILGCDKNASLRNYGIWRNPLKHDYYYSGCINYELSDFKSLLEPRKRGGNRHIPASIDLDEITKGKRNDTLFRLAMRFAKAQTSLSVENIIGYIAAISHKFCGELLPQSEISSIAKSVYKYWLNDSIFFGVHKQEIFEGAMEFEKINGVDFGEYQKIVKERQRASAARTNSIVPKEAKEASLAKAREAKCRKLQTELSKKIQKAIEELKTNGNKVNASSIAKISNINRKTVSKYLKTLTPA